MAKVLARRLLRGRPAIHSRRAHQGDGVGLRAQSRSERIGGRVVARRHNVSHLKPSR
jgi:hypothetical protein